MYREEVGVNGPHSLIEPYHSGLANSEPITYEFEACKGDEIRVVSLEHNAELSLRHDVEKWLSCFSKECRNLVRLNQQLARCQTLHLGGQKVGFIRINYFKTRSRSMI